MLSLDGGFWQVFTALKTGSMSCEQISRMVSLFYETLCNHHTAHNVISPASQRCTTTLLDRQTVGPLRRNAAQLAKKALSGRVRNLRKQPHWPQAGRQAGPDQRLRGVVIVSSYDTE